MAWIEARVPPVVWFALAAVTEWVLARAEIGGLPLDRSAFDVVGAVLGLAGLGIGALGIGSFGRAKTTVNPHSIDRATTLVVTGIYRYTRNPMYLGLLLLLAGWALLLGSFLALAVGCGIYVLVMSFLQIIPEERVLAVLFGTEYVAYQQKVRRWF